MRDQQGAGHSVAIGLQIPCNGHIGPKTDNTLTIDPDHPMEAPTVGNTKTGLRITIFDNTSAEALLDRIGKSDQKEGLSKSCLG
jgi:hypothetical protein